ncbi:MAG: MBOAT family O-acyltransferase [Putridiphycobacter sp.]|nr:MBOAT family O-acyltransferase [Putridiphycobacter sp.]
MLFNSLDFVIFLPLVFILYWFVFNRSLTNQNILLITASYVFYGWWDYRFLSLIIFSSALDFILANKISSTSIQKNKKAFLYISLSINLGLLMVFKYFNFFIDSFANAFSFFGIPIQTTSLEIILPVGISFYTFQTLSYTIDVYRGNLKATKNITSFFAFVSFFPQLVAGPIERATNLLPQFQKAREFKYSNAVNGLRQVLWGLIKKVVIADNCASIVNEIFDNYATEPSGMLIIGAIFFAFQIYGDFSGYSDMAIGFARLFGFQLMRNFAFPYFSRDIGEFWRRWHISLSTWFRDYLYIPLGGSKGTIWKKIRNVFIIFIVSGFWHGANWTFIIWGALNAIYFLPLLLLNKNRKNLDNIKSTYYFPPVRDFFTIPLTFMLTCLAWIFFRADSVQTAFTYIGHIFNYQYYTTFNFSYELKMTSVLIIVFILIEWLNKHKEHVLENIDKKMPRWINWSIYLLISFIIFIFGGNQQDFIYFQF